LLFRGRDGDGKQNSRQHLLELISVLGPPPLDFLRQGETLSEHFDAQGRPKSDSEIPPTSMEDQEQYLAGESKVNFISLIRRMLQWRPEDTAPSSYFRTHGSGPTGARLVSIGTGTNRLSPATDLISMEGQSHNNFCLSGPPNYPYLPKEARSGASKADIGAENHAVL